MFIDCSCGLAVVEAADGQLGELVFAIFDISPYMYLYVQIETCLYYNMW
jgi:hypothetical protein